jgi:hypothetical protein
MDLHSTKKRRIEHSNGSRGTTDGQTAHTPANLKPVKGYTARNVAPQDGQMLAGEMYKSSMFKLQLDELLAEVQPNYEKRMVPIENALRRLKAVIEQIPDREPADVCTFYLGSKSRSDGQS